MDIVEHKPSFSGVIILYEKSITMRLPMSSWILRTNHLMSATLLRTINDEGWSTSRVCCRSSRRGTWNLDSFLISLVLLKVIPRSRTQADRNYEWNCYFADTRGHVRQIRGHEKKAKSRVTPLKSSKVAKPDRAGHSPLVWQYHKTSNMQNRCKELFFWIFFYEWNCTSENILRMGRLCYGRLPVGVWPISKSETNLRNESVFRTRVAEF